MKHHGYMISESLFDWITSNIPKGSTILELGSGDGTKLLTERYKVYSVEHDQKWVGYVEGSTYIYAPLNAGWYDRATLRRELPKEYDLILVDGPPGFTTHARLPFVQNLHLFKTDCPIIIDDTHREGEYKLASDLARVLGRPRQDFDGSSKSFAVI